MLVDQNPRLKFRKMIVPTRWLINNLKLIRDLVGVSVFVGITILMLIVAFGAFNVAPSQIKFDVAALLCLAFFNGMLLSIAILSHKISVQIFWGVGSISLAACLIAVMMTTLPATTTLAVQNEIGLATALMLKCGIALIFFIDCLDEKILLTA